MLTYSNVIESSLANKGGSFNLSLSGSAELPESGFVVGVEKIHQIDVTESGNYDRAELTKWLEFARDRASNAEYAGKRLVIGTWVDKGTFYIDLSEVVDSRERAVQLCKDGDELAYWDIADKLSVDVSERLN